MPLLSLRSSPMKSGTVPDALGRQVPDGRRLDPVPGDHKVTSTVPLGETTGNKRLPTSGPATAARLQPDAGRRHRYLCSVTVGVRPDRGSARRASSSSAASSSSRMCTRRSCRIPRLVASSPTTPPTSQSCRWERVINSTGVGSMTPESWLPSTRRSHAPEAWKRWIAEAPVNAGHSSAVNGLPALSSPSQAEGPHRRMTATASLPTVAPGSLVVVRDEEWLVTSMANTLDGQLFMSKACRTWCAAPRRPSTSRWTSTSRCSTHA